MLTEGTLEKADFGKQLTACSPAKFLKHSLFLPAFRHIRPIFVATNTTRNGYPGRSSHKKASERISIFLVNSRSGVTNLVTPWESNGKAEPRSSHSTPPNIAQTMLVDAEDVGDY